MDKQILKLAAPFLAKCKRHTLPICGYVCIENGTARITDIETELRFSVGKNYPDGLYDLVNGELFPQPGKLKDFPVTYKGNPSGQKVLLTQTHFPTPKDLANLAVCRAKDELRPVMESVCFNQDHIVASDAHVLKWLPLDKAAVKMENEMLSPMPPVLISALNDAKVPVTITGYIDPDAEPDYQKKLTKFIRYEFEQFEIKVRAVEGNYPQYMSVVPKADSMNRFVTFSSDQAREYIKFAKSIRKSLPIVKFTGLIPSVQNTEFDLFKDFPPIKETKRPSGESHCLVMPIAYDENCSGYNDFAFNAEIFEKAITGFTGTIVLGIWDCTRAMLLWLHPETKTTRNTQPVTRNPQPAPSSKRISFTGKSYSLSSTDRFQVLAGDEFTISDQSNNDVVFTTTDKETAQNVAKLLNIYAAAPVPTVTTNPQPETRIPKPVTSFRVLWSNAS